MNLTSLRATTIQHNFLLIIYPAQGQLNPALQFAKRLIAMGARVTLPITLHMHRRISNKTTITGLSLAPFSDGHDDGFNAIHGTDSDFNLYVSDFKHRVSHFITNLILSSAREGRPFTCLTYTLLVPWAPELARGFNLPSAMLWIEPATVLDILYYYFHGYGDYINDKTKEGSSRSIALPGLPFLLSPRDIPSFLLAWKSSVLSFVFPLFEEQIQQLDLEANPIILVNTFEALEAEALRAVDKFNMIPIGPLIPSAFLDGKDPSDTSFGGDLFPLSKDYVEWLDTKAELSVVYVSFGSYFELSRRQTEEIARALLDCGCPFLWVIREKEKEVEDLRHRKELEEKGKIVTWCSQVEVLSHGSVGCFVTHCGWNSTMESMVCGVPMVAFPQWSDQRTNAKLIEDVWKIGVRVDEEVNDDGIVRGKEIWRCLEVVMRSGERASELRVNAKKWKGVAKEAAKEGGPSEMNLKTFLDGVGERRLHALEQ
ncbi:UDP-glycosyltransferase 75C1-like [Abrus precatorius]|uniref:Glycosyltransferase n=1 Tax=Abrus precatorius TaxID=3816 RepID=A0A8B8KKF2_ABRPR|nr:UDP-glycosyltransferase 75C1-like [Abrus precatorius]